MHKQWTQVVHFNAELGTANLGPFTLRTGIRASLQCERPFTTIFKSRRYDTMTHCKDVMRCSF